MTTTTPESTPTLVASESEIEAFADKVFADLLGALSTYATTIGVTLGWYQALADAGPMTSGELSMTTDTDERYAREWLEQQTVTGYLSVDNSAAPSLLRRYALSAAGSEVLTNRESLAYMAPFPGFLSTLGGNLDQLIDAFRTGKGFGWHEHGDGARCGQAEANRPLFLQLLAKEYLPSIDDLNAELLSGARVADIGCGLGWSSIGIAQAYPDVTVDGYDIDSPSIDQATANAAEAGLTDRVQFHATDVGTLEAGGYDVALALECIHDLPDPVSVLASMRAMIKPDGTVIVMDERVADVFTGDSDPVEQMLYGFSLLCCLPDGRNAPQSVATGTVMRRPTFESYAHQAGFSNVEVLSIENDFFRFYRLTP